MSNIATITAIHDRARTNRQDCVVIGPVALGVAQLHIREQKTIAIIADERELVAQWRDEETQIMAALAGDGLKKIIKTE